MDRPVAILCQQRANLGVLPQWCQPLNMRLLQMLRKIQVLEAKPVAIRYEL